MIEKYIKPKTMQPLKKVLGIALLLMGAGFIFNIEQIKELVMNYSVISIGVLIASGYLLWVSGRRQ